jgi:transposase
MEAHACIEGCERCRALEQRVARLEAELAELRHRLDKDSSNSSKPPSSDAPWAKRPGKKKSGRKPGGQPGHPGAWRKMLPTEQVDVLVSCKPEACDKCGTALEGTDPEPQRHQVTELPVVKPHVTEYQLHALACSACGTRSRASLPEGVPSGAFGPRLTMFVSLLSGAYLLSKRQVEQLLHDCFTLDLALGSVCTLERRISESVAAPVEELRKHIREQDGTVNIDETSWKQQRSPGYLWVVVGTLCAVFLVRLSRARQVAIELLGYAFEGFVVSDRYSVYDYFNYRQLCWAHLLRDFRSVASRDGPAGEVGKKLLACAEALFEHWHRLKKAEIRTSTFFAYCSKVRVQLRQALTEGTSCGHGRTERFCAKLLAQEPCLWAFVRLADVEPTNNAAERALRPAVLWRKRSFGTQSESGSRYVERILTVLTTLRLQKRNVLEYLTAAYEAQLHHRPAPSLLPSAPSVTPAASQG